MSLVSVIVPTYQRPERLREALASIAAQTFRDFEIIVVNDGGGDIGSILDEVDPAIPRTCERHSVNRGMSAARNTGLRLARGKYIAWLDDDDIFLPNHLATLAGFLERGPVQAAYTDAICAEERDNEIFRRHVQFSADWDDDKILVRNFVPTLCFMFERACALAVGEFDETLSSHEDWDYWIRLSRVCRPVHLAETTCEFRARDDGTSTTSARRADFVRTARIIHQRYQHFSEGKEFVRAQQREFILDLETTLEKRRRRAARRRWVDWAKKLAGQK